MSSKQKPIAPTKAVFQDIVQTRPFVPTWMRPQKEHTPKFAKSEPPAAAFGRHSDGGPDSLPSGRTPSEHPAGASFRRAASKSSRPVGEVFDPRLMSAALAAEMSESRPPGTSASVEDNPLIAEALEQIHHAVVAFEAEKRRAMLEAEQRMISLVRVIAERVLERELVRDGKLLERLVKEGLHSLHTQGQIQVVVGVGLESESGVLVARLAEDGITCNVLVDEDGHPFSCRIRTELGDVDESLEARLDLVMSSLEVGGEP